MAGLSAIVVAGLLLQADPAAEALKLLDAGKGAEAAAILRPLAEKEPKDVALQFNLSLAETLAGRDTEAIAGFRRVLALKEDLYEARLNLAQLLVKAGQHGEAAPLLETCLEKKPADLKAAYLLGRARAGLGEWMKAEAAFERDPSLKAEQAEMWERAGLAQMQAGELDEAIRSFEQARARGVTPAVVYALATAHLRKKEIVKATSLAEEVVQLEPANAEMRLFAGRLHRDQKQYEPAARHFLEAVKLKKDSGEAWNELSGMLILLKRYEPALVALEKARELNGETPAYHYFRATMLDAMGQGKPALESYTRFLATSGGKHADEEWKARQRVKVLERTAKR